MAPSSPKSVDSILLFIVLTLVGIGFFIFSSASLGLLAAGRVSFTSVAFTQGVLGIGGGLLSMFVMSRIHYRTWRRFALYIFLGTILVSLLIFIPGLGKAHGGAVRWIEIGSFSFQPSELLKVGFIIYIATWFSALPKRGADIWQSTVPFAIATAIVGVIILLQRDTDTFLIIAASGATMFFIRTGRWKDLLAMGLLAIILVVALAQVHGYVGSRLSAFFHPDRDPHGAGWQTKQALIAVGSGGWTGRGYGQSIQKFEYLPEPIGDSIFAVFAEEFGFIGTFILVLLFAGFVFRGYRLAAYAPDDFGMLLIIGIVTVVALQAFLHMAAMVKLAPMLGLPLPFISHGGTAMLVMLSLIGIVLNVSKYQKKSKA